MAVAERLAPFLPGPVPQPVPGDEGHYRWVMPEQSIGRIHGWHGNALVLARADGTFDQTFVRLDLLVRRPH